jgi:heme exporter protein D
MAKAEPEKASFLERLKQIRTAFVFTAKRDTLFLPLVIVAVVIPLAAGVIAFLLLGSPVWIAVGVVLALLAVLIVMNLRANTAMLNEAEGKAGAAAAILQTMRGDWRVTPAVQATTQEDFVHRAVCRAGVVLIGEGNPSRLRSLLGQEKKRTSRVAGDTPIYDIQVGDEAGQISLRKLRSHLLKLPRNITAKQVAALDTRLGAIGSRPPMPKGPMPRNARPPKGAYKAMRGR